MTLDEPKINATEASIKRTRSDGDRNGRFARIMMKPNALLCEGKFFGTLERILSQDFRTRPKKLHADGTGPQI